MIPTSLVLVGLTIVGGSVAGIVALIVALKWREEVASLGERNRALEKRVARLEALGQVQLTPERVHEPDESRETLQDPPSSIPPRERSGQPREPLRPLESPEPPRASSKPMTETAPIKDVRHRDQQWWAGLEERAGKRWMTWAGALALFLSAGFFVKYAFENQWLGPSGRVALGIVAGMVMLLVGDRCLRRELRPLGQGLLGGGLAILYVSLFAAFALYRLVPQATAMGGFVIVTAAGMTLAVLHDAIPLSFLAVLGGFITPVLVSTEKDPRAALFCYMILLDLGVLGVAIFKRWRALDVLAFIGTWALFTGWYVHFYRASSLFPTLLWVVGFYVIFLILPFVYPLRSRTEAQIESFTLALSNAVITFGYACVILQSQHRSLLGSAALVMSGCYLIMGYLFRTRVKEGRRSVLGCIGLAVFFVTLAVPLHLRVHGITLAWASEGPILLYLGYVYAYRPVRIAGALILLLSAVRLFAVCWPLHYGSYTPFLNTQFAATASVPLAAAVYSMIHYWYGEKETEVDRLLKVGTAIGAGFLTLIMVYGEIAYWLLYKADDFGADGRYLSFTAGTIIWALGAQGFQGASQLTKSKPAFFAGLGTLSVGATLWLFSYVAASSWDYYAFLNSRFLAGSVLAATIGTYAYVAHGHGNLFSEQDRQLAWILFAATGSFLLVLLSTETYSYCIENIKDQTRAHWAAHMSLTIVWGVFAVMSLSIGFLHQVRALRLAALGLLAVAGLKLVLVDMAHAAQIYRIVSFVVLGLLMIVASFLYHRLETTLGNPSGES